ncbi:hypothetical protein LSUE1_G001296 [Lachnellula suecica]|uniref:DUF6590 domain-containing protein n=1 Tax=Lachnellula suecica TaxID=602035 RepID=A0A8T9CMA1_9HELO|nr:hypothetical protein LSUE1_G001296 [Lachnellula suecica]
MSNNSKGKGVDKSTSWSEWTWDSRGYYYSSRYGSEGQLQYDYRYPESTQTSQQQQQTPRTPGDNVILNPGSAPPLSASNSGSYGAQGGVYSGVSGTTILGSGTPSYQTRPTTSTYPPPDSYYTTSSASDSQSLASRAPGATYSPELTRYPSSSSNTGSFGSSAVDSPNSEYASPSRGGYDETTAAFRNLTLSGRPPVIPEQGQSAFCHIFIVAFPTDFDIDYAGSSSGAALYLPQTPSNYIKRTPNSPDKERLDPRYRCVSEKEQRKFWKVGRVFMMLWTEPAATSSTRNGTHYSTVWLEQGVYSEIRRFVIIKEGYGNSICSPIHTYNGQATLKPKLPERQQHAIIYTSRDCPPEHSYTTADGTFIKENLSKDPIKVRREQNGPEGDLGVYSRLNYSKIYTVENFVRVLNIGMVEKDVSNSGSLISNSKFHFMHSDLLLGLPKTKGVCFSYPPETFPNRAALTPQCCSGSQV